ncbi:hypothetical protein BURPS668_0295 [Burkholderia pseudomallei 668]|nr:hypothetical protein BURPS668_0295 [Burkholderia pseudomallei 668]
MRRSSRDAGPAFACVARPVRHVVPGRTPLCVSYYAKRRGCAAECVTVMRGADFLMALW